MNEPVKREQPLKEMLHTAVNDHTVQLVRQGCEAIDELKVRGVRALEKKGFPGMDRVVDTAGELLKQLLVKGISK